MDILVVDDEEESRMSIAGFLRELGHNVVEKSNGIDALEAITRKRFQLVLTDIRMPKMSGLDLLGKIRSLPGGSDVDVVLFTGYGGSETALEALQAGALDYLHKPINIAELINITEQVAAHQVLQPMERSGASLPEIAALTAALNSVDEKERAFAAEDIGYDNLTEGIGPLVERLQIEPSRFVREVIVNALRNMKGTELVEQVIPLLRSDDAFIRNATIDILSRQNETALAPLEKLLGDPDKDVRKFALDVMFQLNSPFAANLIAEALDDPDINIVITAVEYLGRLEAAAHIDKINRIFNSASNLLLRCTCLEAMALIGDQESVAAVAAAYPTYESISPLEQYSYLKFVASKGTETHLPLVTSLLLEKGKLMAKEIINAIEGILRHSERNYLPPELLSAITVYLDSGINDINKYELLVLLGEFRNAEIFSLLEQHLEPAQELVCLGAVEGLGLLGDSRAIPVLSCLRDQVTDDDLLEAIDRAIEQLQQAR
ncbi:MAG: response regulator [Syntrophomonadaceae bacterium]|nr:response regulator [Syntrophomonadaceae bacterium]